MPYNSSLDVQLFSKTWGPENDHIVISVCSYNSGPKKLQITRSIQTKDGQSSFVKLGRLTKEEAEGIIPLIQEALGVM